MWINLTNKILSKGKTSIYCMINLQRVVNRQNIPTVYDVRTAVTPTRKRRGTRGVASGMLLRFCFQFWV